MVFRIAECTYGSMHRAFVPAYYPRAIPAFDSPRFFVSQMKIPSPRPRPLCPSNCFFAHACLPLVSHFCRFSYFLTFKRKLGPPERKEGEPAFVFSIVAFYRPKLCTASYSIPLILPSFFFTPSDFFFRHPPSSPIYSTPRASLLVINLVGGIPKEYLVLIYELRVVRPVGRVYLLPLFLGFSFFSSSSFFFLYKNASGMIQLHLNFVKRDPETVCCHQSIRVNLFLE